MKDAELGDYLLWRGKLAKVVGVVDRRLVIIESLHNAKCPHCAGDLGKDQTHVVVDSPNFQGGAEPIKSIQDKSHKGTRK